ncbi:polysaccharide deacetylase family protein [Hymenobacter negativus]|uniref:Polysaccharide deacetylase family protein n=1 Tax=Hymenobacter negativus TaxID=2795026 RepID=A0ABS3QN47_9BACT|nr:polysaccharide deacetylase family protein [Hymenobacter negativus]MBO2012703.1 polysaccharide deacetylase family protein [Hymenobacter negativus]
MKLLPALRGLFLLVLLALRGPQPACAQGVLRRPVPDKLVVLTFDDAVLSHATYVAPLLKKYGFGGSFFVCEFREPPFSDKTRYMSWAQIRKLHRLGFEVASHTLTHRHVNKLSAAEFGAELDSIDGRCRRWHIRKPVTFAYPGYDVHPTATAVLAGRGYQFARAGGSRAYDPTSDHPLLIPSFSISGLTKEKVLAAMAQARAGHIVVLTVHGVPDTAHDWVTTDPKLFEEYLQYLRDNHYQVVALRDLARYVNVQEAQRTLTPRYENLK